MTNSNLKSGNDLIETDFGYTLSLISGKYKLLILELLAEQTVVRFNELQRNIAKISFKMLSSTLKDLEADGLILRKEYPEIPPKVEYSLTVKGKSLMPILNMMCEWGANNRIE